MKAMLSQPMAGRTDAEIIATREKAVKVLEEKGYEIVNTFLQMNGTAKKIWKNEVLFKFRYVFLPNH